MIAVTNTQRRLQTYEKIVSLPRFRLIFSDCSMW